MRSKTSFQKARATTMSGGVLKKFFGWRSVPQAEINQRAKTGEEIVARPVLTPTSNLYHPRIDLHVPFEQKDRAKQLGARWDAKRKVWFVPEGVDAAPFFEWRPQAPKFNLRSVSYYIAESSKTCWHCQHRTAVFSLVLPAGHEAAVPVDEEQEGFGPNDEYDDADFLAWIDSPASIAWEPQEDVAAINYVSLLPSPVIARLMRRTTNYRVDVSKTTESAYWMNHCEVCGVKQGDFEMYHEPGGAFFPMDKQDAELISLELIGEPLYCLGDQVFGGVTMFFNAMRKTG
jgi:hypothetical protein